MIYKKTYQVEGKIITKNEITSLINNILSKLSNEIELNLNIKADFVDQSSLEDNAIELLNDIYFDKKKLKDIEIKIYCNHFDDHIYITLNNNYYSSSISLQINEKKLYDSICHSIEENLNLMDNQNKIYLLSSKSWGYFVLYIPIVALEVLLILILNEVFNCKISTIMMITLMFLIPSLASMYIIKYIEKKYPINQFDFGESSINHFRNEKSVFLKIIGFVITNILLPILVSLITK